MNRLTPVWLIVLGTGLVGCAPGELDTTYGQRHSLAGRQSVNGTSVLSEMFREAGYRVNSWRRLSPKLEDYDVILWFPDDFEPPSEDQREYLEEWLRQGTGRTLVYVGRDYNAAVTYWETVLPSVPAEQAMEASRRLATLKAAEAKARAAVTRDEYADWFTPKDADRGGRVTSLSGPWSEPIDADQTNIIIHGRLAMPSDDEAETWERVPGVTGEMPTFTPLLDSQQGPLVTRITAPEWPASQLLLVTNGSFLLNLPLSNPAHRQLAAELIDACGKPGEAGKAVFLESGEGGPPILDQDPDEAYPTGLEVFTVWPLGIIVLHLAVLGIVCCFVVFPIFGRPRKVVVDSNDRRVRAEAYRSGYYTAGSSTVDVGARRIERAHFGKHIEAVGELLELTQDRAYAWERVRHYQEHVKRDSGASHHKQDSPDRDDRQVAARKPDGKSEK